MKSQINEHSEESDDIFYSDSKAVDYGIEFEDLLPINHFVIEEIRDVRYLPSVFFVEYQPIADKEIIFEIPQWLDIDFKPFNFEGYNVSKDVTKAPNGDQIVTFRAKAIAGYRSEERAPNAKRIFPHLLLLPKSFKVDGVKQQIFETAGDLYQWYTGICKDIGNENESLKTKVAQLTADKKTDLEKIEAIFYWVQDNIRYIAFENGIMGFRPEACHKVYKNLYGDCKGMANLLKQMLLIAKYDARLTWIGTNDIPYDYSTPSLAVDNHMICTVFLEGKKYFLDGTEDYIALGDYATRIQGRQVLIEDGKNHILDHVPTFSQDRNRIVQNINLTLNNNGLQGALDASYDGETKTRILYGYNHIQNQRKEDALKAFIGSGNQNMAVKTAETSSIDDRKNPFKVKATFDLAHVMTTSGNEMYLSLDLDKDFADYVLDSIRVYDLEFSHTFDHQTTTRFTIPTGYKVSYLPETVSAELPFLKTTLKYEQQGSQLLYTKSFTLPDNLIKKANFAQWNTIMKKIRAFYKDQIVLVKN